MGFFPILILAYYWLWYLKVYKCGCFKSTAGMSKILVSTILYGGPNLPPLIGIRLNYLAKTGWELVETSPHMFQWPYQVSSDKEVKRFKRKSRKKTR